MPVPDALSQLLSFILFSKNICLNSKIKNFWTDLCFFRENGDSYCSVYGVVYSN